MDPAYPCSDGAGESVSGEPDTVKRRGRKLTILLIVTSFAVAVAATGYELFLIVYALSSDNAGAGSEGMAWLSGLVLSNAIWWMIIRKIIRRQKGIIRVEALILASVSVISAAFLAYELSSFYGPTLSDRSVDMLTVIGYHAVATRSQISNGEPQTTRYYVGPPVSDGIDRVIRGPGVSVSPVSRGFDGDFDVIGSGSAPERCIMDILELKRHIDDDLQLDIPTRQWLEIRNGSLVMLRVDILCGSG